MLNKTLLRQIRFYSSSNRKIRNVLGIETSCDDTGVAVVSTDRRILSECIYSQWSEHKRLGMPSQRHSQLTAFGGGVIPHLARQLHYDNLPRAVSECIEKATGGDWSQIDALAVTVKPGLEPCLWEGINFAKLLLKRHHPRLVFIPVHHMQAHALTCRLFDSHIEFPFLTLLISGGHCLLALVSDFDKFEILGQSIDISPGNCIDKIARQLGLFELESPANSKNSSSGGSLVEAYASSGGDPQQYKSLIEMTRTYCFKHRSCEFSFTGLVTSLHRLIDRLVQDDSITRTIVLSNGEQRKVLPNEIIANICAIMQHSIVIQLEDRLKRALVYSKLRGFHAKHVVVSGGVASNEFFRSRLTQLVENEFDMKVSCPPVKYCTDNGVMIAWNGCEKLEHDSNDCIASERQDKEFFESIKPVGKCELGHDSSLDLKMFNIKIKANK